MAVNENDVIECEAMASRDGLGMVSFSQKCFCYIFSKKLLRARSLGKCHSAWNPIKLGFRFHMKSQLHGIAAKWITTCFDIAQSFIESLSWRKLWNWNPSGHANKLWWNRSAFCYCVKECLVFERELIRNFVGFALRLTAGSTREWRADGKCDQPWSFMLCQP